jgi:signal transduction histidine kinase
MEPLLRACSIRFDWQVGDEIDAGERDMATTLNILRLVQEAVTNAVKHSGGSVIRVATRIVDTEADGAQAIIEISDDGAGLIQMDPDSGGRGLGNMRRRADEIGGQVTMGTCPDLGGCLVRLAMPCDGSVTVPSRKKGMESKVPRANMSV